MVGTRSAVELAALGPGTMLCDYSSYIFTFLAIASAPACRLRQHVVEVRKKKFPSAHYTLCFFVTFDVCSMAPPA